jgi:hypothetical protein
MPAELIDLKEGDCIEGGTFMQALSDEPLVWLCVRPYDPVSQTMILDVSWMGVDLGRFERTAKGMDRVGG